MYLNYVIVYRCTTIGILHQSADRWVTDVLFKKNLNASKPSEHPPQVEQCLKV